jgi:hypothetical protein
MTAMRAVAPHRRVYPGYITFDEGHRPSWWKDDLVAAAWGAVLGVHEDVFGSSTGALIITERGLAVLGDGPTCIWVPYTDIIGHGTDRLSKDPVSMSLHIQIKSGERIEIPFHHREPGTAFAFVQFLGCAHRWCDRADSFGATEPCEDTAPRTCPHCHTPGTRFRVIGDDQALVCPACGRSFTP